MTARRAPLPPRTMPEILETARRATCGQCWAHPLEPCAVPADAGPDGCHLARVDRACRRGLISAAEMTAVLDHAGAMLNPVAVVSSEHAAVTELAAVRSRLALLRAEYAALLAAARAGVAAARAGDADPLGYVRGVLAERGQLPAAGARPVQVVADARAAMALTGAGWSS